jgi:hypothetical protein
MATRLAQRTSADRLDSYWQREIVPLLQFTPTLMERLAGGIQRFHSGQYGEALLFAVKRRMCRCGASQGGENEVFFAQKHMGSSAARTARDAQRNDC